MSLKMYHSRTWKLSLVLIKNFEQVSSAGNGVLFLNVMGWALCQHDNFTASVSINHSVFLYNIRTNENA